MNNSFAHFMNFVGSLPLSKKISIALVVLLIIAGFGVMFFLANQEDYQLLYNNVSPQDGGTIVARLKEQNIPYRIEAGGTMIMVPGDKVHELRLALAGEGLPGGGTVGFELFDNPDFRTTNFVQELNYRRALQGELARTIMNFKEVKKASVFLAIPKDSLFIEDEKQASASIQLDLEGSLPQSRVEAIVRLVSNAVEGLDSSRVSVVDTKGRVIFRGNAGEENMSSALGGSSMLDYKKNIEKKITSNVQTMLEEIVGVGKAIVRVSAEIDTSEVVISEEEYDPYVTVIRSNKMIEESIGGGQGQQAGDETLNQRAGVVASTGGQKTKTSRNATTNYEINKISRQIVQPAGSIKRLSVAAVIDGVYKAETKEDGSVVSKYVPRDKDALLTFEKLVKNAMGYDENREDQVSVQSVPFSVSAAMEMVNPLGTDKFTPLRFLKTYGKMIFNLFLIIAAFFLVVRPLLKSVKGIHTDITEETTGALPPGEDIKQISESESINSRQRVIELSNNEPERSAAVIRTWITNEV